MRASPRLSPPMPTAPSDFSQNLERFTGYADLYDRFRPAPPADLVTVLKLFAGLSAIDLVVDLGSGTGLSTRYWASHAARVVGVEPTADMRKVAATQTQASNVTYRNGFSHDTGLPDRCAQIVSCSQALHWMSPQETFLEARRILQPGGVFSANDYDWPPTVGSWEAEAAYAACMQTVLRLEKEHRTGAGLQQSDKSGHLARMQSSGCFRHVKEAVIHHNDEGDAERLVGLLLSQGNVMGLLKHGLTEADLGIDRLRAIAGRTLGPQRRTWHWSARLRMGIA